MAKYPLMSPTVDFVFKQIFAGTYKESNALLIDLLNAILGLKEDEKIKEITYLNPYNDKVKLSSVGMFYSPLKVS
ncbi:MAG: PD-(D/E)XK nuclease family transposase [Clostridia bacterium]|nr:PD-(D/E)XK nuclease family transposase [Clostridia bacterium]